MNLIYNMLFAIFFKSGIAVTVITFIVISYCAEKISNALHGGLNL